MISCQRRNQVFLARAVEPQLAFRRAAVGLRVNPFAFGEIFDRVSDLVLFQHQNAESAILSAESCVQARGSRADHHQVINIWIFAVLPGACEAMCSATSLPCSMASFTTGAPARSPMMYRPGTLLSKLARSTGRWPDEFGLSSNRRRILDHRHVCAGVSIFYREQRREEVTIVDSVQELGMCISGKVLLAVLENWQIIPLLYVTGKCASCFLRPLEPQVLSPW